MPASPDCRSGTPCRSEAFRSPRCWPGSAAPGSPWAGLWRGLDHEDAAPFRFPAGHPGDPRRRRTQVALTGRGSRRTHPRAGRGRCHRRRGGRLSLGAVPDALLPDQNTDPVRDLLPGRRRRKLHPLPLSHVKVRRSGCRCAARGRVGLSSVPHRGGVLNGLADRPAAHRPRTGRAVGGVPAPRAGGVVVRRVHFPRRDRHPAWRRTRPRAPSLPTVVITLGAAGAILGDTIGYEVGRHYGDRLLARLPGRLVKPEHVERGKTLLRRRGGRAVFIGRFTAALRVLVAGLAGMSGLPYRRFLAFNVAGAVAWSAETALVGYAAGASYRAAEHRLSLIGFGLLGVIVLGYAALRLRRQPKVQAWLDRRLSPTRWTGRPLTLLVHATGSAWPSGHATTALLGSGLILALTWPDLTTRGRRVTATAVVILTAAVGASRVYLGVHWVSDVLGGWSFGALWLTAAIAALSGYHYRRRLKPADPTRDQTSQNR